MREMVKLENKQKALEVAKDECGKQLRLLQNRLIAKIDQTGNDVVTRVLGGVDVVI